MARCSTVFEGPAVSVASQNESDGGELRCSALRRLFPPAGVHTANRSTYKNEHQAKLLLARIMQAQSKLSFEETGYVHRHRYCGRDYSYHCRLEGGRSLLAKPGAELPGSAAPRPPHSPSYGTASCVCPGLAGYCSHEQ